MKSIMLLTNDDIEKKLKNSVNLSCFSKDIIKAEPDFDIIIYAGDGEIVILKNRYGNIKTIKTNDTIHNLLKVFSALDG